MGYTTKFGNNSLAPLNAQYQALALTANQALVWPIETAQGVPYVAAWIDVTASAGGPYQLQMPPANQGSAGVACTVQNVGANSFNVTDTAGNVIATIATTQAWIIILKDNSTTDGTWEASQLASTTSSATAASLAGYGLQVNGSLLQINWPTQFFSTNQTIIASMRSNVIEWTGAAGTFQMSSCATLGAGFICAFVNQGTGALTVTTTGGQTINGAGSFMVAPGGSVFIVAQTTTFITIGNLSLPLPISQGGTGATTANQALINLGGTGVGTGLFTAPSVAAALAILGLTSSGGSNIFGSLSVTTGGDAIVLSPETGTYATYVDQTYFSWVADATTTGNTTIAVNGLLAKNAYLLSGVQAAGGDIIVGDFYLAVYLADLNANAGGFLILVSQSQFQNLAISSPQGRLTLQQNTPVMNANAVGVSTIYYFPFSGDQIAVLDSGGAPVMRSIGFGGLTLTLDSNAGHSGYQQSGNVFDLYVFLNNGVVTLGTGPAWSTTTLRGSPAALTFAAGGFLVNNLTMNMKIDTTAAVVSVPPNLATYVGTMYATADGQTGMNFTPNATAGGTNNFLGLYNYYNRAAYLARCKDNTSSWTNGANTWQATDIGATGSGLNNRITWIDGMQTSSADVTIQADISVSGMSVGAQIGVNFNSSTASPGTSQEVEAQIIVGMLVRDLSEPLFGVNYAQGMEFSSGSTTTFFGSGNNLTLRIDM